MHGPGTDLFTFFAEKVKEMVPEAVGELTRVPPYPHFTFFTSTKVTNCDTSRQSVLALVLVQQVN